MKSSGFDIEKKHLQDIRRIEKLILLIITAFVWCHKIGVHVDGKKDHGDFNSHVGFQGYDFKKGLPLYADKMFEHNQGFRGIVDNKIVVLVTKFASFCILDRFLLITLLLLAELHI